MLQLVDGDCGKGGKLLPEDHLEPKVRGPGDQGGCPLEDTVSLRRKRGTQGPFQEAGGRPSTLCQANLGLP